MEIELTELDIEDDFNQYCSLLQQLTTINPDKISESQFRDRLNEIKLNPNHKIFVAKLDNKIIGSITVLIELKFIHDLGKVSHIEDVVVDFQYRSLGVGRFLMDYAIQMSKEQGCYKIILDCAENNICFYQKLGFKVKDFHMSNYLNI